jgi:hydrogenase maturation protease
LRIAVYGLGNVLRRDDGFGPSAVRRLDARHAFPDDVTLRDLGTPGLDLPSHLVGHDAVVFLDAAVGDGDPGTVCVYGRDAIFAAASPAPHVTGHEADVRASLTIAELAGDGPSRVWLVGVVPEDLGDGAGLSPSVAAAVEPACDRVLEILSELGVAAEPRLAPTEAGAWWEEAGVPA